MVARRTGAGHMRIMDLLRDADRVDDQIELVKAQIRRLVPDYPF